MQIFQFVKCTSSLHFTDTPERTSRLASPRWPLSHALINACSSSCITQDKTRQQVIWRQDKTRVCMKTRQQVIWRQDKTTVCMKTTQDNRLYEDKTTGYMKTRRSRTLRCNICYRTSHWYYPNTVSGWVNSTQELACSAVVLSEMQRSSFTLI